MFSKSYLVMYVWRHLTGPLSGRFVGPSHMYLFKYNGVVCACSYDFEAMKSIFLALIFTSLYACLFLSMLICALTL